MKKLLAIFLIVFGSHAVLAGGEGLGEYVPPSAGGGTVDSLGDIGDICDANEILERNVGDTAWECIATPAGGAEVNALETISNGVADGEIFVGDGLNSGTYIALQSACDGDNKPEYVPGAPDTFVCEGITGFDQTAGEADMIYDPDHEGYKIDRDDSGTITNGDTSPGNVISDTRVRICYVEDFEIGSSTAGVQECIDELAGYGGGKIQLGPKTYTMSTGVVFDSDDVACGSGACEFVMEGVGPNATVLNMNSGTATQAILIGSGANSQVTLRDFAVVANLGATASDGIVIDDANHARIENVYIDGDSGDAAGSRQSSGVRVAGSNDSSISGARIRSFQYGIMLDEASGSTNQANDTRIFNNSLQSLDYGISNTLVCGVGNDEACTTNYNVVMNDLQTIQFYGLYVRGGAESQSMGVLSQGNWYEGMDTGIVVTGGSGTDPYVVEINSNFASLADTADAGSISDAIHMDSAAAGDVTLINPILLNSSRCITLEGGGDLFIPGGIPATGSTCVPSLTGGTIHDLSTDVIAETELASLADLDTQIGTTGTADGTTFLRGDNTWATPAGGSGAFSDAADPVVLNTTTKDVQVGDTGVALTGKLEIGGDADQPQLVVEGHSTQTDSVFIVQADDETQALAVEANGDAVFGGGVTADSFTSGAVAAPQVLLQDSTTSGEVSIEMDDGAGPDGRMLLKVDVAGALTTFAEFDGINSDIELGTPGTNYVDITTAGVMSFVGTGDIDLPNASVDKADISADAAGDDEIDWSELTDLSVGGVVVSASDTTAGKVELATVAETQTGTDTARAVTPDGLEASTIAETGAIPSGTLTEQIVLQAGGATKLAAGTATIGTVDATNFGYYAVQLDSAADESVQWSFDLPANFDATGAVTATYKWTNDTGTTGTVCLGFQTAGFANDEAFRGGTLAAFAGATDTSTASDDIMESSSITVTETWAASDHVIFQATRDVDGAGTGCTADAMAEDMHLLSVTINYEVNNAFSGE